MHASTSTQAPSGRVTFGTVTTLTITVNTAAAQTSSQFSHPTRLQNSIGIEALALQSLEFPAEEGHSKTTGFIAVRETRGKILVPRSILDRSCWSGPFSIFCSSQSALSTVGRPMAMGLIRVFAIG